MDDFFKMDVFFVATTAVVITGGVLASVALFYLVSILRSVDEVMKNVSEESNDLRGDIRILRSKIREEGMKMKHVADFVSSVASRKKKTRSRAERHDASA